jgi:hypothetical protein
MPELQTTAAVDLPDGRAVLGGLPADPGARMGLCMRLLDTLRGKVHAMDTGEGLGRFWDECAKGAYVAVWLPLARRQPAQHECASATPPPDA